MKTEFSIIIVKRMSYFYGDYRWFIKFNSRPYYSMVSPQFGDLLSGVVLMAVLFGGSMVSFQSCW